MFLKPLSRYQRISILGSLVYVVSFLLLLAVHPGNQELFENLFYVCELTPKILASLCSLAYVWRGQHPTRQHRFGWFLIGLACFSYVLGDLLYVYYDTTYHGHVPFPSWADAAWLLVFPFLLGGMALLTGAKFQIARVRMLLDSAIAASSVTVLSWFFIVRPLWGRSGITLFAKCVSVSTPIGDVAALFMAFVLLQSVFTDRLRRLSALLLASGVILWSLADTMYGYAHLKNTYHPGSWFDWGWPFGALLIAYACLLPLWFQKRNAREEIAADTQTEQTASLLRLMAPYIAVGASLITVFYYDCADGNGYVDNATFVAAILMLLLVMLRQVFTLFENRSLTAQLHHSLQRANRTEEELRLEIAERRRTEEELVRSKAVAEEANRTKSQFLANMSHELRTPLNAIIGFSEVLIDQTFGPMNTKQARYSENIGTAGRHLLQLINDLLDLSKVEAGRMQLECSAFDAVSAIEDIQIMVVDLASRKDVRLVTELPETAPVTADEGKFKQVLFNLLSNAIKFTPEGGMVTTTVRILASEAAADTPSLQTPPDRSLLQVTVTDTGIGLKPEDQQRIFHAFEQIDSSYARKQQGTGLGLTLTRQLIEMHGGQIGVESQGEGQGTRFVFTIPMAPVATAADTLRAAA